MIAPFYLWSVYDSFFEERPGYIYDPASDQLYWLKLRPSIYRLEHWKRLLLPFFLPAFTEILYVERQASLNGELADRNKPFDPEAFERELEQLMEDLETGNLEFTDAEFWVRHNLDPQTLLPPQWGRLPDELGDLSGKVIPADVVIAR